MHILWQTLPLHLPFVRFVSNPATISMQVAPTNAIHSNEMDVRESRVTHFERCTVIRTHAPRVHGIENRGTMLSIRDSDIQPGQNAFE